MTLLSIERKQSKIQQNINQYHPEDPMYIEMAKRYRELEKLKQAL